VSLSRRVSRNTGAQLVGRLYTSTLAFVITAIVLPRQLQAYDFGIFAFYLSIYQLLQNVFEFGVGTIVIREASRDRARAGQLIGMLIRVKGSIAALSVVGLVVLAWLYEGPGSRFGLLVAAAVPLLFHAPAGAAAIFHVDMAFRWSTLASVLGQSAWLFGTLWLAWAGVDRPAPYLIAYGLTAVVNGTANYFWASRRVEIRFDAGRERLRNLWKEAWPAGVSMVMASVYFYVDAAMLRPLQGEVAVARYSVAYRLMTFVLMVPVLFSNVLFPVFSRLWATGADSLRPFFQRSLRVLVALGLTVVATVPLLCSDIMAVVYKPEYLSSARTLAILSLAIVFVFGTYPHVLLLLATGHQRVMMVISTSGAALNIGLNLWAIRHFGIEGAAWTTVATEAFVFVAAAVMGWRLTRIRTDLGALMRPLVSASLAAGALFGVLELLPAEQHVLRVVAGLVVAGGAVLGAGIFPLELEADEAAPEGPR
jgi:O-antigen/teichoic acid export membrane protein